MLPSGPGSAPMTAPHFMPAGSFAQLASRRYGLGNALIGIALFHFGSVVAAVCAAGFAPYVLLKLLRAFVTVNDPSGCADTLNQYAAPLCAGGGGAPGPGAGGGAAAIGIVGA